MSTAYLSEGGERVRAAWETAGQVYFDSVEPDVRARLRHPSQRPAKVTIESASCRRANVNGQVLMVWTEGTSWAKGGSVAWQLFDNAVKPTGAEGHAPGVPAVGPPSVFADRKGNFTIIY